MAKMQTERVDWIESREAYVRSLLCRPFHPRKPQVSGGAVRRRPTMVQHPDHLIVNHGPVPEGSEGCPGTDQQHEVRARAADTLGDAIKPPLQRAPHERTNPGCRLQLVRPWDEQILVYDQ